MLNDVVVDPSSQQKERQGTLIGRDQSSETVKSEFNIMNKQISLLAAVTEGKNSINIPLHFQTPLQIRHHKSSNTKQ